VSLPLPIRRPIRLHSAYTQSTIRTIIAWAIHIRASVRARSLNLISMATSSATPKQVPGLPKSMLAGCRVRSTTILHGYDVSAELPDRRHRCLHPVRLDAWAMRSPNCASRQPNQEGNEPVRIGLIRHSIHDHGLFSFDEQHQRESHTPGTINYAAANLASLLDTT